MAKLAGKPNILTINSGSSSLKASLFLANGKRINYHYASIGAHLHGKAFDDLLSDIKRDLPSSHTPPASQPLLVIGHRFVHGGEISDAARLLDAEEIERLSSLCHLAPLHMPSNLLGVNLCKDRFATQFNLLQIACFDTAFHATLPEIAYRLPIPQALKLRRYGFHGLNYAHIARQLPSLLGETAHGRIVIAHLGSGSSLCLLHNLRSIDTSMGYTPAGGIPMATRSGDLDPGVMLALTEHYQHSELRELVYHQMGLLALSDGESSEMSELITSNSKNAQFAVAYFVRQVQSAIGAYAAKAGGIDALVFTGGIGEHSAQIRAEICEPLAFLAFKLNEVANQTHAVNINESGAKPVLVIPADEEAEIAMLVTEYLAN